MNTINNIRKKLGGKGFNPDVEYLLSVIKDLQNEIGKLKKSTSSDEATSSASDHSGSQSVRDS